MEKDHLWMSTWKYLASKSDFWMSTLLSHVVIVVWASLIVIFLGVVLGILITRIKSIRGVVFGVAGLFYTIPILALMGLFIPLMGIGLKPALVALSMKGILPVIRNTYAGINQVSPKFKEAAIGLGANKIQLLLKIELPLAFPVIFAGIRTAVVMNFSMATYAVFIGAGAMGTIILVGMRTFNDGMLLAGTMIVAIATILLDRILGWIEKSIQKRFAL